MLEAALFGGILFLVMIGRAVSKRQPKLLGGSIIHAPKKGKKAKEEIIIHAGKNVPKEVNEAVDLLAAKQATADMVEKAAAVAETEGFTEEAAALRKAASSLPREQKKLVSPIPTIDDTKWATFAGRMKQGSVGSVTPAVHLGMFLMGMRRLADLGYVENIRKARVKTPGGPADGKEAYIGDFVPPITRDRFLSDPALQLAAFEKSMKDYAAKVIRDQASEVGKEHDGQKATLSGLLGVAHAAGGMSGFRDWLKGSKMPITSKLYKHVNGIF